MNDVRLRLPSGVRGDTTHTEFTRDTRREMLLHLNHKC